MRQTYTDLDKGNSDFNTTGPNLRITKWKSALQVLKENYIVGTGTGDVDDELWKQYTIDKFQWGILYRYNAHNQFLQTWIGIGICGFLILLLSLIIPAYAAYKTKKYIYLFFLILFSLCCMTEAMLCTQKGIAFYALFNSLFAFQLLASPLNENYSIDKMK